jgi:inner membrane protein
VLRAKPEERRWIAAATTVGYATHALLDAFTSYGTMLWWPFADTRVAWNTIAIIDPIYPLLLAIGVWLAKRHLSATPARLALLLSSLYMVACYGQRIRVEAAHSKVLAQEDARSRRYLFPGFITNTRWRGLAVDEETLTATGVVAPWFGPVKVRSGETVARFNPHNPPPEMVDGPRSEEVENALRTLDWFAGDRLYIEAHEAGWWRLCDGRYSTRRHAFSGVFCWRLAPGDLENPVSQESRPRDPKAARALLPWSRPEGYGPPP